MADTGFQEVHMPNGDVMQFPHDMSDDDIRNILTQQGISKIAVAPNASGTGYQAAQPGLPAKDILAGAAKETARGVPIVGEQLAENLPAAVQTAISSSGSPDYQSNLAASKQKSAEYQQHYPTESTGLNLVGGAIGTAPMMAAAPEAFGAAGATTLGRMAGGAFGGGVIGGADAYMRGQNPWAGMGTGAIIGGTAPAIARPIGAAAEGAMNALRPLPADLQGINPKALDWAVKLARMDGLDDAAIQAQFQRLGPEGFLGEYGPNSRAAMGFVAARPGEGKTQIFNAIEQRAQESRARVEDAVTQVAGPRQNMADVLAQSKEAQAQASNPLYEQWRNTFVPMTPELNALIPRLQAAGAFQSAEKKMAIAGAPNRMGTAEWWDYIKRSLDDGIERAQGRAPDDVRLLTTLKNNLVGAIDNHPDKTVAGIWKNARDTWGDHESIMKARAAGQQIFDPRTRSDDLAYKLQDYSAPEYQAHQEGVRDAIATLMDHSTRGENEQLRMGAFNRLMEPEGQMKLAMTYGQDGAAQLIEALKREMHFGETANRTIANSETAARSAVGEMMTPDPSKTWLARQTEKYMFHVRPGDWIPNAFKEAATQRQAQQFEQARNELAPIMLRKGNDAATMAKMLLQQGKRSDVGGNVRDVINALLQGGAAPYERQDIHRRLQ